MNEYKQPYLILWKGIEKAMEALEAHNFGIAMEILKNAHMDAEDAYISEVSE